MVLGVIFASLFATTGSPTSLIFGGSLIGLVWPSLVYVRRLALAGRIRTGLVFVTISLWLLAMLVAARGPGAAAPIVPLLLLPIIVSVYYLRGRELTYLSLGSLAVIVAVAGIAALGPRLPSTLSPELFSQVAMLGLVLTGGTALIALWNVGSLLRDALMESREKNLALEESERRLEEKVEARTAEIGERNRELGSALAEVSDIHEIARVASSTLDLAQVMEAVMTALGREFRFDQMGITLFDAERRNLCFEHMIGAGISPELTARVREIRFPVDGSSFFAEAVRSGEPIFVPHLHPDPATRTSAEGVALYQMIPAGSMLVCPLEAESEVIGAITFGYSTGDLELSAGEIERVQRYLPQLATAIRNARLFEEAQAARAESLKRAEELADIDAIGRAASASLDLDHLLERVVDALQKLIDFDQLCVGLLDAERKGLVLARMLGAGFTEEVREKRAGTAIPTDAKGSVFLHVTRTGEPFFMGDVPADLPVHPADRLYPESNRPKSVLILPLEVDAEVVGLLYFGNSRTTTEMSEAEIERVRRYVTPIAIAIHNARLFEETQAARAEALEASRTKSRFLANMSHELRTPLNAVIGYSEMLQEDARDEGHTGYVEDLGKIRGAGRQLLDLINEVLDLSKVEAGRMELDLDDFGIEELLGEVVTTVAPMAEANRNELAFSPGDELGRMHSDPTKVRQILLNVLSNACKFTKAGEIQLRVERRRDDAEHVVFQVDDTGIGMTPEQTGRIFDAFAQADASTARDYGGTGLGLAITRQFCELLGGSIAVESEPGAGTRFTVDLPVECRGEA